MIFLTKNMEIETKICCPKNYLKALKNELTPTDEVNSFYVRITMLGKCPSLELSRRCKLTNGECIFGDLPDIDRITINQEGLDENDLDEEDASNESPF